MNTCGVFCAIVDTTEPMRWSTISRTRWIFLPTCHRPIVLVEPIQRPTVLLTRQYPSTESPAGKNRSCVGNETRHICTKQSRFRDQGRSVNVNIQLRDFIQPSLDRSSRPPERRQHPRRCRVLTSTSEGRKKPTRSAELLVSVPLIRNLWKGNTCTACWTSSHHQNCRIFPNG